MYLSFSCRIRGVGVKIRDAVKVLFSFFRLTVSRGEKQWQVDGEAEKCQGRHRRYDIMRVCQSIWFR